MYWPPSIRFPWTGNLDPITMGHYLETRQYRISMVCALQRVPVYSRSNIIQWELLQLGLATLVTALALYYLMVCLSLLAVQEILLSTLVLVMVCYCLSVVLGPWKVGVGLIKGVTPSYLFVELGHAQCAVLSIIITCNVRLSTSNNIYLHSFLCRIPCHKDPMWHAPSPSPP